ncbi:MAG: hypothetical protein GY711_21030 [bacterium]|nr:hypothetical protein [bacterium]
MYEKATREDFAELCTGWREHVLAMPPVDTIEWVLLDSIEGANKGEDLRIDDIVWSVDGVEVDPKSKVDFELAVMGRTANLRD